MTMTDVGTGSLSDEDRGLGCRYADLTEAIFANPYQRIWGAAGEAGFPVYEVTFGSLQKGGLPFSPNNEFLKRSATMIDSHADLRWGPDRKGFRRILHPNGICLTGQWHIAADTDYTGYFAKGSTGLAVCRYSTCCTDTRRGSTRSLSMVGKIFPTIDAKHPLPLKTANFITQEDIGGARTEYINDAELRNAPDTTLTRRGAAAPILLQTGLVFNKVDQEVTIRQLYPIAELGKPDGVPTRAPEFLRLLVAPNQPRIEGADLDFRDEIMAQIFDRGDPVPKRTLTFNIEVTDEGTTTGPAALQRRTFKNWRQVGTLTFDNAVASYNGDFVIHFNHPTWRKDRNDPTTATRVDGRRVEGRK
jgi:hypothetical protein